MYHNSFHYTPAGVDCRFCTACSRHRCAAPGGCGLLRAADDLCSCGELLLPADLADNETVDTASLRVIANALLIARFGLDALKIAF